MPKRGTLSKTGCALLVIDMQRYFCDPRNDTCVPGVEMLLRNVKRLVDAFSKAQRPVVATRHIDDRGTPSLMFEWWSENILADDPRSALCDGFDPHGVIVIEKHQYDAFLKTDLEERLCDKDVEQVVVCGVLTNLCCESTARSAFMRGFHVFFVDDATRTYSDEMHRATLLNLSYGFATIMNTNHILKALRARSA